MGCGISSDAFDVGVREPSRQRVYCRKSRPFLKHKCSAKFIGDLGNKRRPKVSSPMKPVRDCGVHVSAFGTAGHRPGSH
jgi:hypothetical protein